MENSSDVNQCLPNLPAMHCEICEGVENSSLQEDLKLYDITEQIEEQIREESRVAIISSLGEDMELYDAAEKFSQQIRQEISQQRGEGVKRISTEPLNTPSEKRFRAREERAGTSAAPQTPPTSVENTDPTKIKCEFCNIFLLKTHYNKHLNSKVHKNNVLCSYKSYPNVSRVDTAFGNRIVTYRIKSSPDAAETVNKDSITFMEDKREIIKTLITDNINIHTALKVNFIITANFIQETKQIENIFDFQTLNNVTCLGDDLDMIYASVVKEVSTKMENFEKKGSGWSLKNIIYLEININKFNPLRGSSFIKLPFDIATKRAIINVQNTDEQCFKWAILSALHPPTCRNPERVSHYRPYENELNFKNISFPMEITDISKFEKLNNVSVNVFGLEYDSVSRKNRVVGPLYHTSSRKDKHVNLLYIAEGQDKSHYCYIKSMSRLVRSQLSSRKESKYICDGCLLSFGSLQLLQRHNENDCAHIAIVLPDGGLRKDRFGVIKPNNILKFESYQRKMDVPFVVYADFESFLSPLEDSKQTPKTSKVNRHDVYSFGYYIKCSYDDKLSKYRTYRGDECVKHFMSSLRSDITEICKHLSTNVPMDTLSSQEELMFSSAINCHICEEALNGDSVRDHDHLTGKFRGAAHNNCNLNYTLCNYIPVFLHNAASYDAHFIVHGLSSEHGNIEVIGENKEKYISFSEIIKVENKTYKIRFLDSFKFMSASLDKLSKTVDIQNFKALRKEYPNESDFKLLIRKGVYPYEYIKSHSELSSVTSLPKPEHFYNQLTDSAVSNEDYRHAQTVWNHFKCNNIGEYSDLYLKTDVLLLTDIFENFRKVCLHTYSLDPAHYFTTPGLTWDAMLKYTKCELELLTDFDKIAFVKSGIRGGVAQCSNRYGIANNMFMPEYDPSKPESYLMYLDANNLYGWAMSQYLPFGNFQWVDTNTDFNVSDTSDTGFILEVDLEYPDTLHDSHSDFPLCPERITVGDSETCKLVTTLDSKKKYIIHYRNLKQSIQLGMKLVHIHRVLSFNQSAWLKKYIDLNTCLRQKACCDFEKDFFKLMNNSLFGKTMENVLNRKVVKLITHWKNIGNKQGAEYLIARPHFHSASIISENLVAIQMKKLNVKFDKPIYIGFCVLDISKTLMYDFHYNYMKKKYQDNVKMLYTDTDSLVYQIYTHNFYEDIKLDLDNYFDTSDYDVNNRFEFPLVNKKKLGLFKDENNGKIFKEFIGLRAKMYAIDVENKKISCRAKGVNKSVSNNFLMDDYRKVLINKQPLVNDMFRFRSLKHVIYTEKLSKVSLSHNDTKRHLLEDSFDTLALGHYKLRNS